MLRQLKTWADEWEHPTEKTYSSQDQHAWLAAILQGVSGPLAYFDDKVKNETPAGDPQAAASDANVT
jgi:hypothetical protein